MDMELLINVYAVFLHKHSSEPVHGKQYSVRLFDQDPVTDDFLGETTPDASGKVHFKIDPKQWRSEDSLNETTPDFYMVVMCEGQAIFKTPVAIDVRMEADAHFNAAEGEWIDLGTFLI